MRFPHLRRLLLVLLVVLLPGCARATPPSAEPFVWQTSAPEEQGMDSALLARMYQAVEERDLDLHSLLVIRNGRIVAEAYYRPFRQDAQHELYSCTKSFVATLIGIAIDQGLISGVEQRVLSCFPRRSFANPDPLKEAMTLEDLLTMTSGLDWPEGDPIYRAMYQSRDWVSFVLSRPMVERPGARFNYNSGCSHVLSAILQEATGMNTLRYAREQLLEPLAITNLSWDTDSAGCPIGGWGLMLTPRDMAKLGLLYLNEGAWQGRQIVSPEWVEAATRKHIETGDRADYGYQWWVFSSLGAYAAIGLGGQMIFVSPQERLVVVFTADIEGAGLEVPLIEEYVLPAIRSAEPLPPNPEGQAALQAAIEAAAR